MVLLCGEHICWKVVKEARWSPQPYAFVLWLEKEAGLIAAQWVPACCGLRPVSGGTPRGWFVQLSYL